MSLRKSHHVLIILLVIWAGGCANPTGNDQAMRVTGQLDQPARTTLKSYRHAGGFDHSLTKGEKEAVIGDLQNARKNVEQARLR
jgi:hypothetical protein